MDETPRPDPETGELIIPENPENGIMEPEMAAEGGDVLSSEEVAAIHDTIAFINRTVSEKTLETALIVGNHVLSRYFNDDLEAAFSRTPYKSVSFGVLCDHPDLRLSKTHLIEMVRVAAQERFLMETELDMTPLNYTHRVKLIPLANDEIKVDMVRHCVAEDLTTRQLAYRVRRRNLETQLTPEGDMGEPETDPAVKAATDAAADLALRLDKTAGQVQGLDVEWFSPFINRLPAETAGMLESRLMSLIDDLDDAETRCRMLLEQLRPDTEPS